MCLVKGAFNDCNYSKNDSPKYFWEFSLAKKLFLEIVQVHSGIWNSVLAKNIILVTMH